MIIYFLNSTIDFLFFFLYLPDIRWKILTKCGSDGRKGASSFFVYILIFFSKSPLFAAAATDDFVSDNKGLLWILYNPIFQWSGGCRWTSSFSFSAQPKYKQILHHEFFI